MSTAPVRAALSGQLNTAGAASLLAELRGLAASNADVVIDCREVDFPGTAAQQMLMALKKDLARKGKTLTLEGLPPQAERWLRLAGTAEILLDPVALA